MPPTGNVTPKHEDFENGKASSNVIMIERYKQTQFNLL